MAKQTVNIGGVANDGTGDPLRTAFDKLNNNFDEVYGNNFVTTNQIADDAVTTDKLADSINTEITANTAKITNATHTGDVTGSTALTIANDVITNAKLGSEFTTSSSISASDVDFSSAAVFTKTLTGTTTLTFSNVETGMVKTLVISGDYSLTFPSGVKTLNGTYSGTATNVIQLISTNGSTEIFATISNYTA